MEVTRKSLLSGITRTKDIDITQEQINLIKGGLLVQNVCKHLSADDREFLISGITNDEWSQIVQE